MISRRILWLGLSKPELFVRTIWQVSGVWLFSALLSFPAIAYWRTESPELYSDETACHFTDSVPYLLSSSCLSFYLPFALTCASYWRVFRAATRHGHALRSGEKRISSGKPRRKSAMFKRDAGSSSPSSGPGILPHRRSLYMRIHKGGAPANGTPSSGRRKAPEPVAPATAPASANSLLVERPQPLSNPLLRRTATLQTPQASMDSGPSTAATQSTYFRSISVASADGVPPTLTSPRIKSRFPTNVHCSCFTLSRVLREKRLSDIAAGDLFPLKEDAAFRLRAATSDDGSLATPDSTHSSRRNLRSVNRLEAEPRMVTPALSNLKGWTWTLGGLQGELVEVFRRKSGVMGATLSRMLAEQRAAKMLGLVIGAFGLLPWPLFFPCPLRGGWCSDQGCAGSPSSPSTSSSPFAPRRTASRRTPPAASSPSSPGSDTPTPSSTLGSASPMSTLLVALSWEASLQIYTYFNRDLQRAFRETTGWLFRRQSTVPSAVASQLVAAASCDTSTVPRNGTRSPAFAPEGVEGDQVNWRVAHGPLRRPPLLRPRLPPPALRRPPPPPPGRSCGAPRQSQLQNLTSPTIPKYHSPAAVIGKREFYFYCDYDSFHTLLRIIDSNSLFWRSQGTHTSLNLHQSTVKLASANLR